MHFGEHALRTCGMPVGCIPENTVAGPEEELSILRGCAQTLIGRFRDVL